MTCRVVNGPDLSPEALIRHAGRVDRHGISGLAYTIAASNVRKQLKSTNLLFLRPEKY